MLIMEACDSVRLVVVTFQHRVLGAIVIITLAPITKAVVTLIPQPFLELAHTLFVINRQRPAISVKNTLVKLVGKFTANVASGSMQVAFEELLLRDARHMMAVADVATALQFTSCAIQLAQLVDVLTEIHLAYFHT